MINLSDIELITKIREENSSEALEVLCKRHEGIFFSMARRYSSNHVGCSGVSLNDFAEQQEYIVYQAAKNFNPEKGTKFVTWLGNQVRYYCLNTIHAESRYYGDEPQRIDFLINKADKEETDKDKLQETMEYILGILEQIKDKRIKEIVQMRYFDENKKNRAFSKIAQKLNMSTQGVIDLHDNFIDFMRRKIDSKDNMDTI